MANRYWVGGTGTWDGTAGSKWSETNGGAGGASVPVAGDNVYIRQAGANVTLGYNTPSFINVIWERTLNLGNYTLNTQFAQGDIGSTTNMNTGKILALSVFDAYGVLNLDSGTIEMRGSSGLSGMRFLLAPESTVTYSSDQSARSRVIISVNSSPQIAGTAEVVFTPNGKSLDRLEFRFRDTNSSESGIVYALLVSGSFSANELHARGYAAGFNSLALSQTINVKNMTALGFGTGGANLFAIQGADSSKRINILPEGSFFGQFLTFIIDASATSPETALYGGSNSTKYSGYESTVWKLQNPPKTSTLSDPLTQATGAGNPSSNWIDIAGSTATISAGIGGGGISSETWSGLSKNAYDLLDSSITIEQLSNFSSLSMHQLDIKDEGDRIDVSYQGSVALSIPKAEGARIFTRVSMSSGYAISVQASYDNSVWFASSGDPSGAVVTVAAEDRPMYRSIRVRTGLTAGSIGSLGMLPTPISGSTNKFLMFMSA